MSSHTSARARVRGRVADVDGDSDGGAVRKRTRCISRELEVADVATVTALQDALVLGHSENGFDWEVLNMIEACVRAEVAGRVRLSWRSELVKTLIHDLNTSDVLCKCRTPLSAGSDEEVVADEASDSDGVAGGRADVRGRGFVETRKSVAPFPSLRSQCCVDVYCEHGSAYPYSPLTRLYDSRVWTLASALVQAGWLPDGRVAYEFLAANGNWEAARALSCAVDTCASVSTRARCQPSAQARDCAGALERRMKVAPGTFSFPAPLVC